MTKQSNIDALKRRTVFMAKVVKFNNLDYDPRVKVGKVYRFIKCNCLSHLLIDFHKVELLSSEELELVEVVRSPLWTF